MKEMHDLIQLDDRLVWPTCRNWTSATLEEPHEDWAPRCRSCWTIKDKVASAVKAGLTGARHPPQWRLSPPKRPKPPAKLLPTFPTTQE